MAVTNPSTSWNLPRGPLDSLNESNNNDRKLQSGRDLSVNRLDTPANMPIVATSKGRVDDWSQLPSQLDSEYEPDSCASCSSVTSQDMNMLFPSSFDIFIGEPHEYNDHAGDGSSVSSVDAGCRRPGFGPPFPVRLHKMLEEVERDGLTDVVSWQPHGRCFVVHKPKEFAVNIMPTYFKRSGKLA